MANSKRKQLVKRVKELKVIAENHRREGEFSIFNYTIHAILSKEEFEQLKQIEKEL